MFAKHNEWICLFPGRKQIVHLEVRAGPTLFGPCLYNITLYSGHCDTTQNINQPEFATITSHFKLEILDKNEFK